MTERFQVSTTSLAASFDASFFAAFFAIFLYCSIFGADTLHLPNITKVISVSGILFISSFSRGVNCGSFKKNDIAVLHALEEDNKVSN